MNKKILFVFVAIFLIAVMSGCNEKYVPQAGSSSTTKPYTIQDRGNGSYLIEPNEITVVGMLPKLYLGYDEINAKCDIVAFSDMEADNGGSYSASSTVAILVKVKSCNEKVDAIPKH